MFQLFNHLWATSRTVKIAVFLLIGAAIVHMTSPASQPPRSKRGILERASDTANKMIDWVEKGIHEVEGVIQNPAGAVPIDPSLPQSPPAGGSS